VRVALARALADPTPCPADPHEVPHRKLADLAEQMRLASCEHVDVEQVAKR
jgi:hypothetical protein